MAAATVESAGDPWAPVDADADADVTDDAAVVPAALPARPVYRYSVIPGGAYSASELAHAVKRDAVVAAAYRILSSGAVRPEAVPADRLAYMSYRIGDRIYWTKRPIALHRGETVLTDGVTTIRGRCGNGISLDPMLPTADSEPGPLELEALSPGESPLLPSSRLGFELADVADQQSPGIGSMGGFQSGGASGPLSALNSGSGPFGGGLPEGAIPPPSGGGSTTPGGTGVVTGQSPRTPPGSTPGTTPIDTTVVPDVPIIDGPIFPPSDGGPPPGLLNPDNPGGPTPPDNPGGPNVDVPPGAPAVPEPGTLLLVGGGLAAAMRRLRRRRQ